MAEWLYEAGIGEARAALVEDGRIVEARIERENEGPRLGAVVSARLIERGKVALDLPGEPVASLAATPPSLTQGARLTVEVVRMALRERGRDKMARVRVSDAALDAGPDLRARLAVTDVPVNELSPHGPDQLENAGWSEMLDQARTGHIPFDRGALWIDVTPAMTLIDIDGDGDAMTLARAGAVAACDAILRFGIGGSIGIDFPSLGGRGERLEIDALVDEHLPQPFERTAVNGFGLMQIIRRRARPSLIEQVAFDRVSSDAATLLRQAERAMGTGPMTLTARPPVADLLAANPDWIATLQNRTGRNILVQSDATIKGAGHAQ